jgi:hypothetical protein
LELGRPRLHLRKELETMKSWIHHLMARVRSSGSGVRSLKLAAGEAERTYWDRQTRTWLGARQPVYVLVELETLDVVARSPR